MFTTFKFHLIQVTEKVVETVNYILDSDVSEGVNTSIAEASSLILKAIDQQVSQTLKEHGNYQTIKANIAVQGVTVNQTQAKNGIGFAVRHTKMGFSKNDASTEQNTIEYIQLPEEALYGNNGETIENQRRIRMFIKCSVYYKNKSWITNLACFYV